MAADVKDDKRQFLRLHQLRPQIFITGIQREHQQAPEDLRRPHEAPEDSRSFSASGRFLKAPNTQIRNWAQIRTPRHRPHLPRKRTLCPRTHTHTHTYLPSYTHVHASHFWQGNFSPGIRKTNKKEKQEKQKKFCLFPPMDGISWEQLNLASQQLGLIEIRNPLNACNGNQITSCPT